MYVRTSHESIEEFNSHKIIQSLVREGSLPLELAQKITEEVENRIYKYQTTYLTGSLIREMVNSVLLEHGHEEYRNKLARLGLPVFDVQEMITNLDNVDNGAEGLLFKTGQRVFAEHLLTNVLPKDVADSHLSGDLHITNPGIWSMIPDTILYPTGNTSSIATPVAVFDPALLIAKLKVKTSPTLITPPLLST